MARKTYSEEFRRQAVELYRSTPGATLRGIATDLGITRGTLATCAVTSTGSPPAPSPAPPACSASAPSCPSPNATCSPASTSPPRSRSSNSPPRPADQRQHDPLETRLRRVPRRVLPGQPQDHGL